MTWLLMWLNVSAATLNSTLQLLVLYKLHTFPHTFHPHVFSKNTNNVTRTILSNGPLIVGNHEWS